MARTAKHRTNGTVPVIDLFAGPGGLGEGFSTYSDSSGVRPFRIALSIEKESRAHETLRLRAFFRQFEPGAAPDDYYRALQQRITTNDLFQRHPAQAEAAEHEAWQAELGRTPLRQIRSRIARALGGKMPWILAGGPPCQAYSLIGRSRQKRNPAFQNDDRHRLYVEYLQVLADFRPGILSWSK